jgi:hypothetical protein
MFIRLYCLSQGCVDNRFEFQSLVNREMQSVRCRRNVTNHCEWEDVVPVNSSTHIVDGPSFNDNRLCLQVPVNPMPFVNEYHIV